MGFYEPFKVAKKSYWQEKLLARKAIGNVCVSLNIIHLSLFTAS